MGMYTEIYLSVELREDTPEKVINVLRHLFDGKNLPEEPIDLPDHNFFECSRWAMIGGCSSFYFVPMATSNMWQESINSKWYITSRSDLKNYGGEIEKFFDFIMPYVVAPEGQFIGYLRYEENDVPTLIFKKGKK